MNTNIMPGIMGKILLTIFLIYKICSPVYASDNLISNPGFENWAEKQPSDWTKNYSTLTTLPASAADQIRSGSNSVLYTSSSNSTKYLYQLVSVEPNSNYHLSAWTKIVSGIGNLYLRASQCSAPSCSSEIKSFDSPKTGESSWQNLNLDLTTGSDSQVLKVKLSLDPASSSSVSALWDNASLEKISPETTPDPPAPTASPTTPEPSFDIAFPGSVALGSAFDIHLKLFNFTAATYFLKVRLGPDTSHLTHGQTENNGNFLDDNDAWSEFRQITPSGTGWEGDVKAKLPEDETAGNYKIVIRAKNISSNQFYESDPKDIAFTKISRPTPQPTTAPRITSQNQASFAARPIHTFDVAAVLAASTASSGTTVSGLLSADGVNKNSTSSAVPKNLPSPSRINPGIALIGAGGVFLGLAGIFFFKNRYKL